MSAHRGTSVCVKPRSFRLITNKRPGQLFFFVKSSGASDGQDYTYTEHKDSEIKNQSFAII